MTRVGMWVLLGLVAGAAAVLSFAALRDLAALCGFSTALAWLLPVTVDAGAAAGCLAWLAGARRHCGRPFARGLTWTLLAASVAGNALVHGLSAYQLRPAWWVVVAVSAVAPAVLGAVVHLAVLVARVPEAVGEADELPGEPDEDEPAEAWPAPLDEHGSSGWWETAPPAALPPGEPPGEAGNAPGGRVAELIGSGAGRRRLARELGVSEHEARRLLARSRNGGTAPTI